MSKAHCGNYGNLLSRIFGKNFVKVTDLPKKSLNSWFDEIFFFSESKFFIFPHCGVHSVEIRKFLSQAFFAKNLEKFRENNAVKELLSKMVLEMAKFCIFRANSRKFDLFGVIEEGLD